VARLFDKRATWSVHRAAGIPVPEALAPMDGVDQLLEAIAERGWGRAYVKLSSGSSASGLAVLRRLPDGTPVVMTTMRRAGDGWFNSLRLQRAVGDDARRALAHLLREGAHVERGVEKARLEGRRCDLRVLVVEGQPAFAVLRSSTHPITNLHLGGRRGDLAAFRRGLAEGAWEAAMETCRRVAAIHGCHHLGVDLMFTRDGMRHLVVEANAFGDLLPGRSADGVAVYELLADRLGPRRVPRRLRALGPLAAQPTAAARRSTG
jgi:glutathione synthase/RimK-type ligase-like ATP-grasp enzyme